MVSLTGAEVEDIVRDCGVTCERPELPLGWPDPDDDFDEEAYFGVALVRTSST